MKKRIFFALILIVSAALAVFIARRFSELTDYTSELVPKLSIRRSLPLNDSYDSGIVIKPYEKLSDRDGIDFSTLRRRFGDAYKDDGTMLLVLIKKNVVTGFATIPRGDPGLEQWPARLSAGVEF